MLPNCDQSSRHVRRALVRAAPRAALRASLARASLWLRYSVVLRSVMLRQSVIDITIYQFIGDCAVESRTCSGNLTRIFGFGLSSISQR